MKQTLLMERVMGQTRLAVIEDNALCELYIERPGSECLSGNIYLGRVENVLPGMNAAFVEIGAGKKGFLAAGDIRLDAQGDQALSDALGKKRVESLVRPGRQLLVQVTKAATGQKGPRLSSNVTLPGRLMVLLPGVRYVGISKKIADDGTRKRLRNAGGALLGEYGHGMILRTAAADAPDEMIRAEYTALNTLWRQIDRRAASAIAPKLIQSDANLALRAVRDMLNAEVEALWADDRALLDELSGLAELLAPQWASRIRLHEGTTPVFNLYRVDAQADEALQKYVWLKGGGSLVIEETEALTVIDVNTGKNVGRRDPEETIFRNNCEAAREIMRQLRLRDLGGIVIIDFIDMAGEENRLKLLELLRQLAAADRNHVNVVGITGLGLVELTRKKLRPPLSRQLLHTCSDCGGNGWVPSHETTARRIEREIWRRRRAENESPLLVEAPEPVCGWLKTIGAPKGGRVYVRPIDNMKAGEYRILPADEAALPPGAGKLK